MLLGAAVPPLLLLATRRWCGPTVGRATGIVAAAYIPSIYFEGIMMKPGLSLFLVSLTLYLLSRALDDGDWRWWLGSGATLAMAGLTRGNLLLVLPVLALWFVVRAPHNDAASLAQRIRDRTRWIQAATFTAGATFVLAFPAIHNYAVGGEFIPTTSNAGANFYIGNNATNRTGEYQALPFVDPNPQYEQRDFKREAEKRSGRELSHREISRFWFQESIRWIRSDPRAWLTVMWRKVGNYWGAYERPDSLDYYLYRQHAPVLRIPLPGFGLLAPLALTGAVLAWRRRGWPRLLILLTVSYALTVVTFFVFSRFRMVSVPALFVFAGLAVVEIPRRLRAFKLRPAGLLPVGLFLLLFAWVNLPVRSTAETLSYRFATSVGLPTKLETSANAHFNLGVVYHREALKQDDPAAMLTLAEAELRRALEQDVKLKFHIELGKVLARQQRNADAIEVYRHAQEFSPRSYRVRHALGTALPTHGRSASGGSVSSTGTRAGTTPCSQRGSTRSGARGTTTTRRSSGDVPLRAAPEPEQSDGPRRARVRRIRGTFHLNEGEMPPVVSGTLRRVAGEVRLLARGSVTLESERTLDG